MEHVVQIEMNLTGDTARLYKIFADSVDSVTPSDFNRAVLETGVVHHALMLAALEIIPNNRHDELYEIIERMSEKTIMRDLFEQARDYWEGWTESGTIEPESFGPKNPES